jgi:four helix bundle protein
MYTYSFENLYVWRSGKEWSKEVFLATGSFANKEKYGLTFQQRRSIISVSNNIPEVSKRNKIKEKMRCIEFAYGSLLEILNGLILVLDLGFLDADIYKHARKRIQSISKQLEGLRKSFLSSPFRAEHP